MYINIIKLRLPTFFLFFFVVGPYKTNALIAMKNDIPAIIKIKSCFIIYGYNYLKNDIFKLYININY